MALIGYGVTWISYVPELMHHHLSAPLVYNIHMENSLVPASAILDLIASYKLSTWLGNKGGNLSNELGIETRNISNFSIRKVLNNASNVAAHSDFKRLMTESAHSLLLYAKVAMVGLGFISSVFYPETLLPPSTLVPIAIGLIPGTIFNLLASGDMRLHPLESAKNVMATIF
jgi:hypothetical protein